MRITKFVLALVFAIGLAIPSFAVELSLGGFPSYMRFRWRTLTNATAHSVTNGDTSVLGSTSDGEQIHFADMTLRLTPQLVLSDAVTIRATVDVLSNAIAGGANSGLFGATENNSGGVVMSDISTADRFNGTLLFDSDAVDENSGSFKVKLNNNPEDNITLILTDNDSTEISLDNASILLSGGTDSYNVSLLMDGSTESKPTLPS